MDLDNIFRNLETSDNTVLFKYLVILIIFLAIFRLLPIGINIVFGIGLAVLLVLYLNSKKQYDEKQKEELMDSKKKQIRPKPIRIQDYEDLVNFIYSIQDLYIYNPQSYEEMIDEIDNFLLIYEEAKNIPNLSGINYGLMDKYKLNAINSLHAIIYNLTNHKSMIDKLNRATDELDVILNKYSMEIYNQYQVYLVKYGYQNSTKLINKGPKEGNYYEDKEYTYYVK